MRLKIASFALATTFVAHSAVALPAAQAPQVDRSSAEQLPVVNVQWRCDPNRCLNVRTGAYTASSCDWRGCRPSSGIVGYIDGRGQARGVVRGGRWECTSQRCRDVYTGAYTASSCDWRGCRPSSGILGYTR